MKRFWLTCLGVFVVLEIAEALIHGPLLGSTYATLANVWRPEMANWAWAMHLVNAFFTLMFVYVFTKSWVYCFYLI